MYVPNLLAMPVGAQTFSRVVHIFKTFLRGGSTLDSVLVPIRLRLFGCELFRHILRDGPNESHKAVFV